MATKLIGLATILLSVANDDFVFLDKKYVILVPFFLGAFHTGILHSQWLVLVVCTVMIESAKYVKFIVFQVRVHVSDCVILCNVIKHFSRFKYQTILIEFE